LISTVPVTGDQSSKTKASAGIKAVVPAGPSTNLAWSDRVTTEIALDDSSGNGKVPFCDVVFAEPPSRSTSIRCTPCPHPLLTKIKSISPMPRGRKVDGIFIGQCIFFPD
jgi:hypothetical protein